MADKKTKIAVNSYQRRVEVYRDTPSSKWRWRVVMDNDEGTVLLESELSNILRGPITQAAKRELALYAKGAACLVILED